MFLFDITEQSVLLPLELPFHNYSISDTQSEHDQTDKFRKDILTHTLTFFWFDLKSHLYFSGTLQGYCNNFYNIILHLVELGLLDSWVRKVTNKFSNGYRSWFWKFSWEHFSTQLLCTIRTYVSEECKWEIKHRIEHRSSWTTQISKYPKAIIRK